MTGKSIVDNAAPFVSFDTNGNNIIGPAYPTRDANSTTLSIQTIYIGASTGQTVKQFSFPGYTFYTALIDPVPDVGTGRSFVYLTGWSTEHSGNRDRFVVARASVTLSSINPSLALIPADVLSIELPGVYCYEVFDDVLRPHMNLTKNALVLVIPGRCALFVKITLPDNPLVPFGTITSIQRFDPLNVWANVKYVSSVVFDHSFDVIYYILKRYDFVGAGLYSFSTETWQLNVPYVDLETDVTENEAIIVLGTEYKLNGQPMKYLFVVASGSYWIERFEIHENNTIESKSYAFVTTFNNQISSAYYYPPYLYFTTYEPDAKIARISRNNFCAFYCGQYSYCRLGTCTCIDGYAKDMSAPNTPCKLSDIIKNEMGERQSQGAAAALGVLFAFTLLAAFAGWGLWYRVRK